jgi:hypothetical protein
MLIVAVMPVDAAVHFAAMRVHGLNGLDLPVAVQQFVVEPVVLGFEMPVVALLSHAA